MLEKVLYKNIKKALPDFFLQRIESITGLGIPDLWMSHISGVKMWAELKAVSWKNTVIVKVPFRQGQYAWIRRAIKRGTPVCLLISVGNKVYLFYGENIQESYNTKSMSVKADVYCGNITSRLHQIMFRDKIIERFHDLPF